MFLRFSALAGLVFFGFSCAKKETAPQFSADNFLKHVTTLSSDAFLGRAPATEGEAKTVEYLTAEFRKYGLKPAFDGSFVQDVPVSAFKVDKNATSFTLRAGKNTTRWQYLTDLMAWPSGLVPLIQFDDLELVYVGYGIIAPEENWDDYKGLDVKGKVLVFKNSDPYSNPDRFKGNARLYYGRYDYKYEIAAKLGARGALIIHTTPTAGYPWNVVANSWEKEQFRLKSAVQSPETLFNGWISLEAAEKMFKAAGLNLAAELDRAESPDFKPIPLKNQRLSGTVKSVFRDMALKNVGALLPGKKTEQAAEHLVITAHHDHLGTGSPVRGDSVFNGALDNATGVAALLNIAEALAKNPQHINRSILFLAVSGEEKGLLGAKYYAANPSIKPHYLVMNLNIDGMNISGRTRDLVSIGFGRSTIDQILEKAAAAQKRYVRGDPRPELGYFYRSDHFAFAKIGVPVLYINTGRDFIDKPDDFYDTVLSQYLNERYHTVFDEINAQWDVSGALEDLSLMYSIVKEVASGTFTPTWNPGDEFEQTRLNSLKNR